MKRRIAVVALVFVAFALIAQQALAQNAHFIRASGSVNNDGSLTVNFKEAGLGTNQNIDYVLSADGTALYVCVIPEGAGTVNPSDGEIAWMVCRSLGRGGQPSARRRGQRWSARSVVRTNDLGAVTG